MPGVGLAMSLPTPEYCHGCGEAMPWTEAAIQAAIELATETPSLDPADRNQLSENLKDLVSETPRTPLAVSRMQRIMAKAGPATARNARSSHQHHRGPDRAEDMGAALEGLAFRAGGLGLSLRGGS